MCFFRIASLVFGSSLRAKSPGHIHLGSSSTKDYKEVGEMERCFLFHWGTHESHLSLLVEYPYLYPFLVYDPRKGGRQNREDNERFLFVRGEGRYGERSLSELGSL